MKLLFIIPILLTACSSPPKVRNVTMECEQQKQIAYAKGYDDADLDRKIIMDCIDMQIQGGDVEYASIRACVEMGRWYGY